MPQLFPMNWLLLTILFSLMTMIPFILNFFTPLMMKKFFCFKNKKINFNFKW
uniref:ATP synthase subunit 8 n=1 Tax=Ixodes columnae TaxID=1338503 RepID=A0A977TQ42_9ACAR|nr:ATP synthase F0 subunit 8 [Ixodes kuntzi]YP_010534093.1 ATP synthase F0 subunit 8 [Ixodes columnae]UNO53640.1 ATP synthase F0 subunit 8 [Ixodes kuntzi]UXX50305.1 ATP synthase subunit 8 [Ixodes columnae]